MIICRRPGCRRHGWMRDLCPEHYARAQAVAEREAQERAAERAAKRGES